MITIIIASYNQQEYLPDAIESALSQKGNREVIVVDDGSTDKSLEIAKSYCFDKYTDSYYKVISQVNKGLASARNTGIMNATGDWILPLDADDILKENCVEKLLSESEGFDIVAPSFKEFGVRNNEIILMENPTLEDFKTGNRIGYFSLIRKSKLLEIGGYSPKMVWGYEDYHLWFNLLSTGACLKTIQDVLVLYRTKETSMITTAQQHHDELMNQINKDFNIYE